MGTSGVPMSSEGVRAEAVYTLQVPEATGGVLGDRSISCTIFRTSESLSRANSFFLKFTLNKKKHTSHANGGLVNTHKDGLLEWGVDDASEGGG